MRSSLILVLGLVGTLMIGACSQPGETSNAQVNSPAPVAASNTSGSSNPANANTGVIANGGSVVAAQAADANVASTASSDTLSPQVKDRLEKMRHADTNPGAEINAAELAMKNARPAPDNSTFTTYLTDAGYEIRIFKNSPQILKVEKKIENNGSQSLKVFLRNGNLIQLPGNAVPVLSNASAASIASAAGLTAPPVKAAETSSTGAKKAVN